MVLVNYVRMILMVALNAPGLILNLHKLPVCPRTTAVTAAVVDISITGAQPTLIKHGEHGAVDCKLSTRMLDTLKWVRTTRWPDY